MFGCKEVAKSNLEDVVKIRTQRGGGKVSRVFWWLFKLVSTLLMMSAACCNASGWLAFTGVPAPLLREAVEWHSSK